MGSPAAGKPKSRQAQVQANFKTVATKETTKGRR
jgi:hypothetical protein